MNCELHRQEQAHKLSQADQVLPSDTAEEQMLPSFNLAKPARWLHGPMQT